MASIPLLIEAQAQDASGGLATASVTVQVNEPGNPSVPPAAEQEQPGGDQGDPSPAGPRPAPGEAAVEEQAPPGTTPRDFVMASQSKSHEGGEKAPAPGSYAVAPGSPGYSPAVEYSRQLWSGWASR